MKENTPEVVRPQTEADYFHATELMYCLGGGFAEHIACAYGVADSHNRERLRAAFPDLFTKYFTMYVNNKEQA